MTGLGKPLGVAEVNALEGLHRPHLKGLNSTYR